MFNSAHCRFTSGSECQAAAILQAVSSAAERFLQSTSADQSIGEVLDRLGRATGASRVRVLENQPGHEGDVYLGLHSEWAAPGTTSRPGRQELKELALAENGLRRWVQALGQGQLINGQLSEFPPGERQLMSGMGIKSLLAAPVFVGQEWWGVVSLEDAGSGHAWSPLEVDAVRAVAGMFGSLIQRRRTEEVERKLMQMKDDFIASLSHELRTPLYAITGFIELLQRNKVKDVEVQQEFMGRIAQNADRLMALVNELLDASRLEAGRIQLELAEVDVCQLVAETLRSLDSLASQKGLIVQCSMPDASAGQPIMVPADPRRVKQVLVNLVSNAIKFSRPQDHIQVSVALLYARVRIEVVDNGPGIAEDDQGLIFTKFYRAESSVKNAIPGTGLGLYISKMIVDAHGGSIGVQSVPGQGSTFYFELPLADQPTEVVLDGSDAIINYGGETYA